MRITRTRATRQRTRPRRQGGGIERFVHALSVALRSGRLPAFLVAAGSLFVLYGFLLSGDFLVGSVIVHGARLGDPAQVVTTADAIGEPIFTIDASDAAERVAALPYVEHATVRTRFPDEVMISIVERAPVVTWKVGTRSFLVDQYGNVLAERNDAILPSVTVDGDAPAVGGRVDAAMIAAVSSVREAFGGSIAELRWSRREGLVARLTDKRVVIFGDAKRIPLKLAVYAEVSRLADPWSLLDLREPDRPYYE